MIYPWNRKIKEFKKKYTELISILENGDIDLVHGLLWQPTNNKIEYLLVTYEMLLKLKKTKASSQNLRIHKTFDKGKYQLIIFEVPWLDSNVKYSPLIFDKVSSKIVGVMLPFNEINGCLSKKENSDISKLGIDWVGFTLSAQLGI